MLTSKRCGIVSFCHNSSNIETCVDMYIEYMSHKSSIISVNRRESIRALSTKAKSGSLLLVYIKEGRIRGWILASKFFLPYFQSHSFYVEYFCTDLKGVAAFNCLRSLHEAVIKEAEVRQLDRVVSTGGFFDNKQSYVRSLGKLGWRVDNNLAVMAL